MSAFINGMGIVSPQGTFDGRHFPLSPVEIKGDYRRCIEPDYEGFIPAKYLRRMSRILKMGSAAALLAVKDASIARPDAIITGTGHGCLEDTGVFLSQISEQNEYGVNPTPFMQSTHNTIGSQVALILQCTGYNQTYTHGACSFEHALLDAMMHVSEDPEQNILTGGVDEWTPFRHTIERRLGKYQHEVAGEGAAYFVLSGRATVNTIASLRAVRTFSAADRVPMIEDVYEFLQGCGLKTSDIDLVLTAQSADPLPDGRGVAIAGMFDTSSIGTFNHLCGEYSVASSFAVGLAAGMLKDQRTPDFILSRNANRGLETVLICSSSGHAHNLILLQRCQSPEK